MVSSSSPLWSQLAAISQKLHEASPTAHPDVLMPLMRDLASILSSAGSEDEKSEELKKALVSLAENGTALHKPLLAILQDATSRDCREFAVILFARVMGACFPFSFDSDVVEQLLAALQQILPDEQAKTDLDEAIYRILSDLISMPKDDGSTDYRDAIVSKHEAFLLRAETLVRHSPGFPAAGLFLLAFYEPGKPRSCPVGTWVRYMGLAIDIAMDGGDDVKQAVVESAHDGVGHDIEEAVKKGRDEEVFAAIGEHLVPRVGRLVEIMTTSNDDNIKRAAMNVIGCVFRFAHISYIEHYTNIYRARTLRGRVAQVLREPSRVLVSDPRALSTMAALLGTAASSVVDTLELTPGQEVTYHIANPLFVFIHLTDIRFHDNVKMEAFAKGVLMSCLYAVYRACRAVEKVLCDKSEVSVVGACCELLAKHARGEIDMIKEGDMGHLQRGMNDLGPTIMDIPASASLPGLTLMAGNDLSTMMPPPSLRPSILTIISLIIDFVACDYRPEESGDPAANEFRQHVLDLPSVRELRAIPRDANKLPKEVMDRFDLLADNPDKFCSERHTLRILEMSSLGLTT
ncbi:unnamed protein product [Vitrella brassicaformis CCMP3155]|uniref:Uncharacterized protein n=2 Tax=Vitrella brassicaformis TaxID=1169539 RepID=A0A0G4EP19_VITBC|nr:unnamed protein product [Vitrella brassicaformis CCMP3155]|eukprot:CEL99555.1 unnamed protein product [Vitrella brassicaformis CCMP3155]